MFLTGSELHVDKIVFDDKVYFDIADLAAVDDAGNPVYNYELQEDYGRFIYSVHCLALKTTSFRIEKKGYFPFIGSRDLNVSLENDNEVEIDLGRIRNAL